MIMVVDDDQSMLKVIDRMLTIHGFDAELFRSGEEFERVADLSHASCLVLDINLGSSSGFDIHRHILDKGFSTPTIFITGNDSLPARQEAQKCSCAAYLVKPFPVKSLIDAIEGVLVKDA